MTFFLNYNKERKIHHIKDEEFLRGKVPMTKEEIRFVSLGKMEMKDDDICLDIGGGTGSVSMEMARFARNGKVFVIERNDEAVELIHKNKEKLGLENITVIKGMAPDGLKDLNTKFNKIFIGGSAGNLVEIIKYSYDNLVDDGILVLNFIVLENIFTAVEELKKYDFKDVDICQLIVSKNRKIKDFNMMMAENPIYVITAKK